LSRVMAEMLHRVMAEIGRPEAAAAAVERALELSQLGPKKLNL